MLNEEFGCPDSESTFYILPSKNNVATDISMLAEKNEEYTHNGMVNTGYFNLSSEGRRIIEKRSFLVFSLSWQLVASVQRPAEQ